MLQPAVEVLVALWWQGTATACTGCNPDGCQSSHLRSLLQSIMHTEVGIHGGGPDDQPSNRPSSHVSA